MNNLPSSSTPSVLCCYLNATSKIQVARITNIPNWYFERVVFPGQKLMFEADPEAKLEIHSGMMASSILSDTIPCRKLVMTDQAAPSMQTATELQALEYQNEGVLSDRYVGAGGQDLEDSSESIATVSP